jgi:hypothetical protein
MRRALWFSALCAVALMLQLAAGAYQLERGAFSDEAAHFMNGLLLRDYITQGLGQDPIRFAEEYYLSYPKIAPLAWPPLFQLMLGVFLLPGWPPHGASLVLMALVTAYAAWRLGTLVAHFAPTPVAVGISMLFLLTRVVMDLSATVMVDVVVAALMLEAVYWLSRFWSTGRRRDAVLFGVATACCCLSKGNGVALVLVPGLLMLITRRFTMLTQPGLYLAAVIVAALVVPTLLFSYRLAWAVDDFGAGPVDLAIRFQFYFRFLASQIGWLPIGLAVIGVGAVIRRGGQAVERRPVEPALAALVCGVLLFHLVYEYVDGRYAVVAVAPLLGLIPTGVGALAAAFRRAPRALPAALYAAAVVSFAVAQPVLAVRRPLGFREAARFLEAHHAVAGNRLFVVSDEHGEGAFVAEIAAKPWDRPVTVIRASKVLSGGDWIGSDFSLRFDSPPEVTQELEDLHVAYVLVDSSPGDADPPHWRAARDQMIQAMSLAPDRYERAFAVSAGTDGYRRDIAIYRVKYRSPGAPKALRLDLRNSIGRVLKR